MHIDARELEDHSLIEGDLCIVGAGAAGISIALQFLGSPLKVILLEGGGFQYEDRMQELYAGQTSGQRYFPLKSIRLHYFGGTTGHWAGFCAPFDELDFEKRDWIPHSGWPITQSALDPYYARAQQLLELGPWNYDQAYWMQQDPSMVSLPFDPSRVWNKFWQFSPPTRFGKKYRDAIVNAPNIHLHTYANLTDIEANETVKEIRAVTVRNLEGKTHKVRAKKFILACCAVQNARLLLASNKQAPKGLGNDRDLVGRFFMEHIEIKSAELWLTRPDPLHMYMWQADVTKARAELAIAPALQRQYQILNGTSSLSPLEVAKDQQPFIDVWEDAQGEGMAKRMREDSSPSGENGQAPGTDKTPASRAFQLFTRMEQAPNPDSRVTLDKEPDSLGVRRAHLHWELTPLEKRSIRRLYLLIGQEAGRSGIGRVRLMEYLRDENDNSWPAFTGGGWHHMGTTRMSQDPGQGVVDPQCRVHGLENLYVAGSSCFPTGGAANPTLTLVALSLRLADHVKGLLS
jgi:choline dehydrogenase-like flavoprotein